jgi:hypothetical protein
VKPLFEPSINDNKSSLGPSQGEAGRHFCQGSRTDNY